MKNTKHTLYLYTSLVRLTPNYSFNKSLFVTLHHIQLDPVPRIVAQSTYIPQRLRSLWLRVTIAILSTNADFICSSLFWCKINGPQCPRPATLIGRVILVVDRGLAPRHAPVKADVDADDAIAPARVGITRQGDTLAGFNCDATGRIQYATGNGQVLN